MQQTSYLYHKGNFDLTINKMPIWFGEKETSGDKEQGKIVLHSNSEYDDAWGADAKIEITFEKKDRLDFYHAKEVQKTIDMYNAINMVVTEKQRIWIMSHEFTYWIGSRSKMIRKRFYSDHAIHAVFYCEVSERQFDIHVSIIQKHFGGFKPYVLDMFNSINCH